MSIHTQIPTKSWKTPKIVPVPKSSLPMQKLSTACGLHFNYHENLQKNGT